MPSLGGGGRYGGSDVGRVDSGGKARRTDRSGRGDRSREERQKQAIASTVGSAIGGLGGPITAALGSGIGGYAGGMKPGRAVGRGVGSLLGAPLGPLGMMAGGALGGWLGSNMPQGGGAPGQRQQMMGQRNRNGGGMTPLQLMLLKGRA